MTAARPASRERARTGGTAGSPRECLIGLAPEKRFWAAAATREFWQPIDALVAEARRSA
jgi:hypothetical protein